MRPRRPQLPVHVRDQPGHVVRLALPVAIVRFGLRVVRPHGVPDRDEPRELTLADLLDLDHGRSLAVQAG